MITTEKGELKAECDNCGDEEYGGTLDPRSQDDFKTFVQELKRKGWKTKKIGDEWTHKCRLCSC